MRLSEIVEGVERSHQGVTEYRFRVTVDGKRGPDLLPMRWRVCPRAALAKMAAMMERRHPGREVELEMDW